MAFRLLFLWLWANDFNYLTFLCHFYELFFLKKKKKLIASFTTLVALKYLIDATRTSLYCMYGLVFRLRLEVFSLASNSISLYKKQKSHSPTISPSLPQKVIKKK